MDIRYKSFVTRSKQDHAFDQLLQKQTSLTKGYSLTQKSSADMTRYLDKSPTQFSNSRKKVNVITFTPDESNELIARSVSRESPKSDGFSQADTSLSSDSNKFSNNIIPSILRTSRLPFQKAECTLDASVGIADSASKIIAAKRKAARECLDTKSIDDSKRRFSPTYSSDLPSRRAVSPEILKPEKPDKLPYIDSSSLNQKDKFSTDSKYSSRSIYSSPTRSLSSAKITDISHFDPLDSIECSNKKFIHNRNIVGKSSPEPITTTSPRSESSESDILTEESILLNKKIEEIEKMSKSRPIIYKKSKLSYNPRPWQSSFDDDDEDLDDHFTLKSENVIYRTESEQKEPDLYFDFDEDYDYVEAKRSEWFRKKRSISENGSHKIIDKTQPQPKEKYPILENVKEAYECQETGEAQDLLDDVEYLIEGLKTNIQPSTKTLSIISLTSKCLSRSFRELLKAHGLLTKIFNYLEDAHTDESLALCTAGLFLVFSRDKQPRIFTDDSLELLLRLPLISRNQVKLKKDTERLRDKIRLVLDKFHTESSKDLEDGTTKHKGHSSNFQRSCLCCRHMKLDNNVTTEDIVVECLLQLSSKKAVEWFKNQIRKFGGLDLICDQISASVEYMGSDLGPQCLDEFVMDRLYRLFNYMRFLEHMTFQNRDNQSYLIDLDDGNLINNLWRCLKLCAANLSYQSKGSQEKKLIQACLMAILRLLANISHDNEWTSNQLGCCNGLLKLIFSCLFHLPRFMSSGKRFDLSVLSLALLINLAEHCSENRLRMAYIALSRKRVACLGKSGQVTKDPNNPTSQNDYMEFSFEDETEEEDMDLDDDDGEDLKNAQYISFECESSETKINVLEALVKLFLRHDDRARNNTIIEGDAECSVENNTDDIKKDEENTDPKWRIITEKSNVRKHKGKEKIKSIYGVELSDSEDEESDEGADVEFLINSKEEEEELQKKLSAAGQHMQDSVVSAYTALLLGCIIKGSSRFMERIREHLPSGKFKLLAFVLAKFLSILSITSGMGKSGEESILEIVRLLEAQDGDSQELTTDLSNPNHNSTDAVIDDDDNDDSGNNRTSLSSKPIYSKRHASDSFISLSTCYSDYEYDDHNDESRSILNEAI